MSLPTCRSRFQLPDRDEAAESSAQHEQELEHISSHVAPRLHEPVENKSDEASGCRDDLWMTMSAVALSQVILHGTIPRDASSCAARTFSWTFATSESTHTSCNSASQHAICTRFWVCSSRKVQSTRSLCKLEMMCEYRPRILYVGYQEGEVVLLLLVRVCP